MLKDEAELVRNSTVVEQEDGTFLAGTSLCAMLGSQIIALGGDPANPCGLPTELDVVELYDRNEWMSWAPLLIAVTKVKGNVYITNQKGLKFLTGLFPRLEEIEGNININGNDHLISIDGAFPSLRKVGESISIFSNPALKSLAGGFPALTSMPGNGVSISNNAKLTTVGTGDNQVFASLAQNS